MTPFLFFPFLLTLFRLGILSSFTNNVRFVDLYPLSFSSLCAGGDYGLSGDGGMSRLKQRRSCLFFPFSFSPPRGRVGTVKVLQPHSS